MAVLPSDPRIASSPILRETCIGKPPLPSFSGDEKVPDIGRECVAEFTCLVEGFFATRLEDEGRTSHFRANIMDHLVVSM